jgi:hypothetical protein
VGDSEESGEVAGQLLEIVLAPLRACFVGRLGKSWDSASAVPDGTRLLFRFDQGLTSWANEFRPSTGLGSDGAEV